MSDSELDRGAVLVQIGAAFEDGSSFGAIIGWPEGSYYASEQGMAAHGISAAAIAHGDPANVVDQRLFVWLVEGLAGRGLGTDAKRLVPVGFNVGAFDLPFVRAYLPLSYGLLSRRVIDLNAFCLALDARGAIYNGSQPKWSGWKRLAQAEAERRLRAAGETATRHDARFDALEALAALRFLGDCMVSPPVQEQEQ